MDLYDELVTDCSPYIFALIYDIDERTLIIECVADPKNPVPVKRLLFTGIVHYSETSLLDHIDDENMDDIVDISASKDSVTITTYKKEITLKTRDKPQSEAITD